MVLSFLAVIVFGVATPASPRSPIELGTSRDEVIRLFGAAANEVQGRPFAMYRWGSWTLDIRYESGAVEGLRYTKGEPLVAQEIALLLGQNGGAAAWKPVVTSKTTRSEWRRGDGASAAWNALEPRVMTLELAPQRLDSSPTRLPRQPPSTTASGASAAPAAGPNGQVPKTVATRRAGYLNSVLPLVILGFMAVGLKKLLRTRASPSRRRPTPSGKLEVPSVESLTEEPAPRFEAPFDWQDFELLTGEIYRRQGYEVELPKALGADGGVDLRLRRGGEVVLVQCKFSEKWRVGAPVVREFCGVLVSEGACRGIIVTKSTFSRDARDFAAGKPLELIDGAIWEGIITASQRPGENLRNSRDWIDSFVRSATWTEPACPACKGSMKLRSSKAGSRFWGCVHFPRCRGKRDARTAY
jgi:hypothetical protein